MLRAASYECDGIWEHHAVLRALKRIEKYDLLFCQVSVLEEEEKLRTWVLGHGRDVPLVACAARSREQVPKAIYECCTFLQVPFDREQLVSVVQRAFEHCDQTAKCYEVRGYVINTLGYLELVQGKKTDISTPEKGHRRSNQEYEGGSENSRDVVPEPA